MKNSETGDLVIFFQKSHLPSLHCFPCNLTQNKAKKKKYFLLFLVVSKDPKQWKKGKQNQNSELKSKNQGIPANIGQISGVIKLASDVVWFRENQTTQEESFRDL